ncbi:MAG: hypothetical protein PHT85_17705 [Methylovulum sp.]|nr:hypothetical protein [Methylovulum sp.]
MRKSLKIGTIVKQGRDYPDKFLGDQVAYGKTNCGLTNPLPPFKQALPGIRQTAATDVQVDKGD